MSATQVCFWACVAGVAYIYAGYPILVALLAHVLHRRVVRAPNDLRVSVIISMYNEADRIGEKVRNVLASHGADRIVEILIGSDGSTDDPEAALFGIEDKRIKLHVFSQRRGKPSVLNDLVREATGDILVMMDVRQRLEADSISALVENFSDPTVGVVSGELMFQRSATDTTAAGGIDAYWHYEKWIRNNESVLHSVPGATGALYAVRRELVKPIPPESALDDVLIPMRAVASGSRCVFDPRARIFDFPAQDSGREAIRKRRTLAGCVQLMKFHPAWLVPFGHPIWWQYASHKISRLFSPILLAGALITNALLLSHPFYAVVGGLQAAFWLFGFVGVARTKPSGGPVAKFSGLAGVFLVMQLSLVMAWKDGLTRRNLALWEKA